MSREKLVDGNVFLKNREQQQWVSPTECKNSELNSNCPEVWIATLASCAVWEQGMECVVKSSILAAPTARIPIPLLLAWNLQGFIPLAYFSRDLAYSRIHIHPSNAFLGGSEGYAESNTFSPTWHPCSLAAISGTSCPPFCEGTHPNNYTVKTGLTQVIIDLQFILQLGS